MTDETKTDESEIQKGREILQAAGLEGRISDDELVVLMHQFRETFGVWRWRPDRTGYRAWPEGDELHEAVYETEDGEQTSIKDLRPGETIDDSWRRG